MEQVFEQVIDFCWDGGQVEVFPDERRGIPFSVQVLSENRNPVERLVCLERCSGR